MQIQHGSRDDSVQERLVIRSQCKVYAKLAMFMQSLCKEYAQINSCGTAGAADELHCPTPPPLILVSTADSTVTFGPVSAFTGPVLFEPDCGLALTVMMQPVHKLALHDVRQRDSMTGK
jgi:hypothetical protein